MAKYPYQYFRIESRELLEQLSQGALELDKGGASATLVPRLLRHAHTLKGAARVVKQTEIANHVHAIEDALAPWRDAAGSVPRQCVDEVLTRLAVGGPCDVQPRLWADVKRFVFVCGEGCYRPRS